MMTGIQNVNSLEAGYYAATLIFIGWFALYDFRRHLVRNQALAIFFFWCLLSLPLTASTSLLPVSLLILQAVMGFLNGGLILLAAAWITHGGIGGGDIKLAALLGLLFGTRGVCLILFIAAISALAFVLLISGRNRSSPCACLCPISFSGFCAVGIFIGENHMLLFISSGLLLALFLAFLLGSALIEQARAFLDQNR